MQETKYSTYDIRAGAVKARISGMSMNNIANAYQVNRSTVHRWIIRCQSEGEQGLIHRTVTGRPSILEQMKDETFKGDTRQ